MTELHDDADLRVAFRAFAEATNPYVRPPGAERAQDTARGRIRTRRIVASIAAAVAVIVPAGIVAVIQSGAFRSLPMPPATSTPTSSPSPSPSASSTSTASPTPSYGPDGQPVIGPGALANATLALSWPDPEHDEDCGGNRTFVDGVASAAGRPDVHILSSMRFDVDGDAEPEIVASLFCARGQVGPMQLLAVRSGGPAPLILGPVLVTASTDGGGSIIPLDGPGVATIQGYAGLGNGVIQVDVKSRITCCGTPPDAGVVQQRTYRWTGSSFEQVGGPSTFVADPAVAEVDVTVPTLTFGPPVDGFRSGTLSVTIRNNGPQAAADVSVYISHHLGIEQPTGGDWDRCREGNHEFIGIGDFAVCRIGDLAAGQAVTLTLPMRRSTVSEGEENSSFTEYTGVVEVRTGTFYYPTQVEFGVEAA